MYPAITLDLPKNPSEIIVKSVPKVEEVKKEAAVESEA